MNGDNFNFKSSRNMFAKKIITLFFAIMGILSICVFLYIKNVVDSNKNTICQGICIENTSIGGLSIEEAKEKVKRQIEKEESIRRIILVFGKQKWILPYNKFNGTYNYDEIIHQAFNIGHTGSILKQYRDIRKLSSSNNKKVLLLSYTYNKADVYNQVQQISKEIEREPKDAHLQRSNGDFQIEDEIIGIQVDIESTTKKIMELVSKRKEGSIDLVINKTTPHYTRAIFSKVQVKLGAFSTQFNASNHGRTANLKVASSKINGIILDVDEVFSLNKAISPLTYEEGYREAPVIVNGELVPDIGGGVCQIATTVYNAVLLADLKVEERSNHSLPVSYVEIGRDAAVAADQIDFKFRNSTPLPIYIESFVRENQLFVNIYGCKEAQSKYNVKFESVIIEETPPKEEEVIYDPQLEKGKKVIEIEALEGKKVKLYKSIYDNQKLVSRQVVNTSYYRPRRARIRVGTLVKNVYTSESELQ